MHVPIMVFVSRHTTIYSRPTDPVSVVAMQKSRTGIFTGGNRNHRTNSIYCYVYEGDRSHFPCLCRVSLIGTNKLVDNAINSSPFFGHRLIIFRSEVSDLSTNSYFVNVYIKTHMRATAYVFGLLTGYIVHVMQEKR